MVLGAVVLGVALAAGSVAAPLEQVTAKYETASNFADAAGGDADADDPAIWTHPTRPGDSIVVGTLKNGGLAVFDLRGRELQHVAPPLVFSADEAEVEEQRTVLRPGRVDTRRHDRTLYASSQGDSTFARYDIDGRFRYVGGSRWSTPQSTVSSTATARP